VIIFTPDFINVSPDLVGGTCENYPPPKFCLLFCAPFAFYSSMLASLGAQSRFANFFFSLSFCGLCNLADSFIKKIPVPGFSISMSMQNLLE
jgi:hypothetical protein